MAQHQSQSAKSVLKTIVHVLAALIVLCLAFLIGLIAALTFTEYQPAEQERIDARGTAAQTLAPEQEISFLTWNVGYGALGSNADFFMDGGSQVLTADETRVKQNIGTICLQLSQLNPDIALFQEVDVSSNRSHHLDQTLLIGDAAPAMESIYATNYRTALVPFGMPPYGDIESGLLTLNTFAGATSTRIALPRSYAWPLSTVQLKRCELITRIPVEGSTHELVVINEHPDAYTDEEHHAAQIAAIRETLEKEAAAGNWVIAGGDWNHSFSTVDISAYPMLDENNWAAGVIDANEFSDGWQFIMDNSAPTCRLLDHPLVDADDKVWPEATQYYVLDGFIVSKNIQVVSVETRNLGFEASDHNPVVMKVLLKND